MVEVSPEQAARFFHTVEVNLNQTTTMVGKMPATPKVHAVETRGLPKGKSKGQGAVRLVSRELRRQHQLRD